MKKMIVVVTVLTVSGIYQLALGQSLSDWQNALRTAKSNKSSTNWAGLNSIPYESIRRSAESEQAMLNDLKLVQYACQPSEHGTNKIRNSIRSLEDNLSRATTDADKTKINDELRKQKDMLNDMIEKAQKRAEYAQKVVDARKYVRMQVDNAISKAKSESDPAIKAIAQELASLWEDDRRFHAQAILDAEQAVRNCKDCADGRN